MYLEKPVMYLAIVVYWFCSSWKKFGHVFSNFRR